MKKLTGNEIIKMYLNYFKDNGHMIVESASLIPHNDPSVLWINAGVTPLKKYFDGSSIPQNRRMTSCQKCIRTGDIENVGRTARHHTFFQMLGNFSIGDYFKDEALSYAYDLLTNPKYFDIDKNKLYVTVYPDDVDAYNKWVNLGIDPSHIIKLEGNYWEIGVGPSGPDSEIFYDRGVKYDPDRLGIKLLTDEIENDRYIEIWNNVFSQYNAKSGVPRNQYEELPSKNIDTGMGVERMACILQEVDTNYETDLFMPIMRKLSEIAMVPYMGQLEFRVIADHIRTITFALSDGASFENFGRGYVLRRLLRRSSRMGRKLNIGRSFLAELVDCVVDNYKEIYPELEKEKNLVKQLVTEEEELFQKTLLQGEKIFDEICTNSKNKVISGIDAFKLYDTYGYPIELTEECALERGFTIDKEEFLKYMEIQKEQSRRNRQFESSMNIQNELLLNYHTESNFIGYDTLGSKTYITDIIKNSKIVDKSTSECFIFLQDNPFYAESGGQVSDKGYLKNNSCKLEVLDVIKCPNKQHMLRVKVLSGVVVKGESILTHVDYDVRKAIQRNHSSVHLLQKTLQELLGDNVTQAGSRVDEHTFRFDFRYRGRLSDNLIERIEKRVNERVSLNSCALIEHMSLDEAKKKGAMALFLDKYDDVVRVVSLGDSVELCGGTHVSNTKDIEKIAILSVENKGSDTYRIEGTTADCIYDEVYKRSLKYINEIEKLTDKVKMILNDARENNIDISFDLNIDLSDRKLTGYGDIVYYKNILEDLKQRIKKLDKEYNDKISSKSLKNIDSLLDKFENINGHNILISKIDGLDVLTLKQFVDNLANRDNSFVLLVNINKNNFNVICKSNIMNDKINCGLIVKDICTNCHGNGGGNRMFAQGGGNGANELDIYLDKLKNDIKRIFEN